MSGGNRLLAVELILHCGMHNVSAVITGTRFMTKPFFMNGATSMSIVYEESMSNERMNQQNQGGQQGGGQQGGQQNQTNRPGQGGQQGGQQNQTNRSGQGGQRQGGQQDR
jgi:hypothetical protein